MIYLVRHGETEKNLNGIVQGHTNSPLTIKGVEQSKQVASKLKDLLSTQYIVYCSDLGRAVDSWEHMSKVLENPPVSVTYTSSIRERNLGSWEGKVYEEVKKTDEYKEYLRLRYNYDGHGGESVARVMKRLREFWNEPVTEGRDVLVVSHQRANSFSHEMLCRLSPFGGHMLKHDEVLQIDPVTRTYKII